MAQTSLLLLPVTTLRALVSEFALGLSTTTQIGVQAGVAVAVGVGLGVGVGVVPACSSNDPLSTRLFTTRLNAGPRWSLKGGGVKFGSPASMAGLTGNSA